MDIVGCRDGCGDLSWYESHDTQIEQRQIHQHLSTKEPQAVVVGAEVTQQKRREP